MPDEAPRQYDQASKEARRQAALARLNATKERLAREKQQASDKRNGKRPAPESAAPSSASAGAAGSAPSGQNRDARNSQGDGYRVPKKFKNYIEYDLSKIKDSAAGFVIDETAAEGPSGMSLDDWKAKQKIYQPPVSLIDPDAPKCFECGAVELDFRLYNIFKARVCKECREKIPDKYSLLTKTECKEDYLLTDPELRDEELLPHMERPNPHKDTYNNMMLYLRYQVEEFAFKKWGGPEGLDAEWERRVEAKRERKERKFRDKLLEMRKKTRAEQLTRRSEARHVHEWSAPTEGADGTVQRRCAVCGFTTEEIVF